MEKHMTKPANDRLAFSLVTLRNQVNVLAKDRSKISDGWIGDKKHASRKSDHNPVKGIVHALDITNDPANGMDSHKLAEALIASKDKRISYIIDHGQIISGAGGPSPWRPRKYTGANSHSHHVHISVTATGADDGSPWDINMDTAPLGEPVKEHPVLREGDAGPHVKTLQSLLRSQGQDVRVDGEFGPKTEKSVMAFQKKSGLIDDGVVGRYTWEALEKT
jgi:hypothetical protein